MLSLDLSIRTKRRDAITLGRPTSSLPDIRLAAPAWKVAQMPIKDDGDIVRGLGFVALYAAYLEEQIDNLLVQLRPLEDFTEVEQRWQTSRKIDKAKRLVATIQFQDRDALLADLDACRQLLEWRNELIHGRIYSASDRPDTLKSGRAHVPDREVQSAELFELANNLADARLAVYRPMILQIPKALQGQG